jgi:tetratricopeptide (TPR) repeat protein
MACLLVGIFAIPTFAEEPLMINTDTEDISLTDDLDIAKAQVEKYPDNAEAHFNLAIALSRTSYVEQSIKELRKTKKLIRKPENAGLIDKKIDEYKEILKHSPDNASVNNIRYRLAFTHYLKAYFISKEIEKKEKLENKTTEKSKEKKKNAGIDLFSNQKLIKIDNDPQIKESLEQSLSYFKEVLKHDPNDSWAKVYYGFILAEQFDDFQKAKKLWNEVVKQDPSNPAPHLFLGEAKIKEGNLKEGLLEITQAILLRSISN